MNVNGLLQQFRQAFGDNREAAICRAPGRVNIIGEHTDYNGLPVLPMTTAQDIRIASAPREDDQIRLRNADPAFPSVEFRNKWPLGPSPTGSWENYCKAAIDALNQHFRITAFRGMDALVTGTIPIAAGLSSSSALIVATALAYLQTLGKELGKDISRIELAALLAEGEHYVGTRGGGMDQAIILNGQPDQACKIDFYPLRLEYVPLRQDWLFVVSNSLVKADKTGDALHRYNAGPRLCRLITALVEKQVQLEFSEDIRLDRLADLWFGHLCLTYQEVTDLFQRVFHSERMTLQQVSYQLDLSPEQIRRKYIGDLPEPRHGFRLKSRARHQVTEYRRVEDARDALLAGDAAVLGDLMNASHESCARDYEVSCPELDLLVQIARESGAIGARLTGAGFGGCIVSLVEQSNLDAFLTQLHDRYYTRHLGRDKGQLPPETVFVARASARADYC